MPEIIGVIIAFLGMWGSLWYKLGKLTGEVKHHNQLLQDVEHRLDNFITGGKGG